MTDSMETKGCACVGPNAEAKKQAGAGLQDPKAYIDVRYCGANVEHCAPMRDCPNEAILVVKDERSGFGQRFVVDEEKCSGCGVCIDVCCGDCIELREAQK